MRTATGCPPLDILLSGGIEHGVVSMLFGEGGAGKTNLCLQLARNVARAGRKVAFVDTEGVSLDRLGQLCRDPGPDDVRRVMHQLLFFKPYSLAEQESHIDEVYRIAEPAGVGLVVVDSIAPFYRLAVAKPETREDAQTSLRYQLHHLQSLARKAGIPVIVTTHVYTDVESGTIQPIGGHTIEEAARAVLQIEKAGVHTRRVILRKHRSSPAEGSCVVMLADAGVVAEDGDSAPPSPLPDATPPRPAPAAAGRQRRKSIPDR